MITNDNDNKYLRAKDRVAQLKKFYGKLASYLLFIAFLAGINYYSNEWRSMWFLWVAFFWGIGIVIEAGKTFGLTALLGSNWEERKINEMMKKENEQEGKKNKWE
jgi:hypothetical protein